MRDHNEIALERIKQLEFNSESQLKRISETIQENKEQRIQLQENTKRYILEIQHLQYQYVRMRADYRALDRKNDKVMAKLERTKQHVSVLRKTISVLEEKISVMENTEWL